MKRCFAICLVPVLIGATFLIWLRGEKENLDTELAELNRRPMPDSTSRRARSRTTRPMIPKITLPDGVAFPKTVLEEVREISHLSREEVKSLAAGLLAVEKGGHFGTGKINWRTILARITEEEPDWVLRELEKREEGKKYQWHSRTLGPMAFDKFLAVDAERALEWYEMGVEDRLFEFFDTRNLGRLAAGELLKSDPERAMEVLDQDALGRTDGAFPRFFRLENSVQISKCVKLLPRLQDRARKSWLARFVAAETYRLEGAEGLRRFINSRKLPSRDDRGVYDILGEINHVFRGESAMRDLVWLTRDAPREIREDLVGKAAASWGYYHAPAAEKFISENLSGRPRQIALERLVGIKSEYDLVAAFELLEQIESEPTRLRLEDELEKRRLKEGE